MKSADRFNDLVKRAAKTGHEISWSSINQAYIIFRRFGHKTNEVRTVAIKSDLDEVEQWLRDQE